MISNCNQILKWLNLMKSPDIDSLDRGLDSSKLTNFKFYKLYPFINNILFLDEEYILVSKNNIMTNKFYYNLKFDVFRDVKTRVFLVIPNETEYFGNSTPLQFDKNLIFGGIQ